MNPTTEKQRPWLWLQHYLPALLTLVALIALACALWIPFGVNTTALFEEWQISTSFDQTGTWVDLGRAFPNRPFIAIPFWIGYLLTPDSYVGMNVVHLVLFVLKGFLFFKLLMRMGTERYVAFLAAILFVVYPADEWLFNSRALTYHFSLVFFLLALNLLLSYWQKPRFFVLASMWTSLLFSLGSVEVAFPLALVAPALLLPIWRNRGLKSLIYVSVAWYAVPFLLGLWTIWLFATDKLSYQMGVLAGRSGQGLGDGRGILFHLVRAYRRHFSGGWRAGFESLPDATLPFLLIVVATAALITGLAVLQQRISQPRAEQKTSILARRWHILVGLSVIGLGFVMFLPSPPHRLSNERVFYFSSAGAAIVVAQLVQIWTGRMRWPGVATACFTFVLAVGAIANALDQKCKVVRGSLEEQRLLAGIATALPAVSSEALIVIFDDKEKLARDGLWLGMQACSHGITWATRYLYRNPQLLTMLCYPGRGSWGPYGEICDPRADGVMIDYKPELRHLVIPYNQVIALRYHGRGKFELLKKFPLEHAFTQAAYNPRILLAGNTQPPFRSHTLFATWPFRMPHLIDDWRPRRPQHYAHLEFDRHVPGEGWWPPEKSATWTSATESTIELWLEQDFDYQLEFHVTGLIPNLAPDILESLSLEVNGHGIKLDAQPNRQNNNTIFRAVVPKSIVASNSKQTILNFRVNRVVSPLSLGMSQDGRMLGLFFDSLTASPIQPE